MVAAFQGKRRQAESLEHSRDWEGEARRTQEPKIVPGLPSGRATWTCPGGDRLGARSSGSRFLSPHHTFPTNAVSPNPGMMEVEDPG